MKTNDPFFSVVIPVYNRHALATEAVQSVLKQSYPNFEIIVIDDGSTDDSYTKLSNFFENDKQVKIIKQPNRERGAARNAGIKLASGQYVAFLDSDDIYLPNHLETLYTFIQSQNFPDFIATKFQFLRNGKRFDSDMSSIKEGFYNYRLFLSGNPLACNFCIRKENKNLRYFEEDRLYAIKEDWMFLLENLYYSKIFIVDRVTVLMNDHALRSMRSDNQLLIKKTFLAIDWIQNKISLSVSEKNKLLAHANYFCAIHSYLDSKRIQAIRHLFKSIRQSQVQMKHAILLAKIVIGYTIIRKLTR